MGKLFNSLKKYFDNTSEEQLEKDWDEVKHLNDIGCDVIEYHKAYIEMSADSDNRTKDPMFEKIREFPETNNHREPSCKLSYASHIDTPPHKTGIPKEWLDELE